MLAAVAPQAVRVCVVAVHERKVVEVCVSFQQLERGKQCRIPSVLKHVSREGEHSKAGGTVILTEFALNRNWYESSNSRLFI